jgi:hypothetical protein
MKGELGMMKIYFQPTAEVLKLTQEDVIRTSTEPTPEPEVQVGDNFHGLKGEW